MEKSYEELQQDLETKIIENDNLISENIYLDQKEKNYQKKKII